VLVQKGGISTIDRKVPTFQHMPLRGRQIERGLGALQANFISEPTTWLPCPPGSGITRRNRPYIHKGYIRELSVGSISRDPSAWKFRTSQKKIKMNPMHAESPLRPVGLHVRYALRWAERGTRRRGPIDSQTRPFYIPADSFIRSFVYPSIHRAPSPISFSPQTKKDPQSTVFILPLPLLPPRE